MSPDLGASSMSVVHRGGTATPVDVVVIVSADAEWPPTKAYYGADTPQHGPYGEYFCRTVGMCSAIFMHGGWGKIRAAASAEHAIATFNPTLLINLGTCGGLAGRVRHFEMIAADRTIVSDIAEAFGDADQAIRSYATSIDLSWANGALSDVTVGTLLTADRDLVPQAVADMRARYPDALGADWESGAIACVAACRRQRLLVLRCVSDVVSEDMGELDGDIDGFRQRAAHAMTLLLRRTEALLSSDGATGSAVVRDRVP